MGNILAATTSGGTSSEFTVSDPVHVHVFPNNGLEFVGIVEKKNSDGSFSAFKAEPEPGAQPIAVDLNQARSSRLITAPGTYRVVKSPTVAAIGVDTD